MSSSEPKSKIDFLDSAADTKKKISTAFCEEGNIEENGVLSFFKAVAVPISELRLKMSDGKESPFVSKDAPAGTVVTLNRDEKYGGNLHFSSYQAMETEFAEKKLHPKDLKSGMVRIALPPAFDMVQRLRIPLLMRLARPFLRPTSSTSYFSPFEMRLRRATNSARPTPTHTRSTSPLLPKRKSRWELIGFIRCFAHFIDTLLRLTLLQVKKIGTFAPPKGSKKPQQDPTPLSVVPNEAKSTEAALAASVDDLAVSDKKAEA
jgi:hypothetical protein